MKGEQVNPPPLARGRLRRPVKGEGRGEVQRGSPLVGSEGITPGADCEMPDM